jgi:uncharacterized C2H2 Zn-finger protein
VEGAHATCLTCGKFFKTRDSLRKHVRMEHNWNWPTLQKLLMLKNHDSWYVSNKKQFPSSADEITHKFSSTFTTINPVIFVPRPLNCLYRIFIVNKFDHLYFFMYYLHLPIILVTINKKIIWYFVSFLFRSGRRNLGENVSLCRSIGPLPYIFSLWA